MSADELTIAPPLAEPPAPAQERPPAPTQERLMSLDALRGFDMFWIVGGQALINGLAQATGSQWAGIKTQFEHVPWEGFRAIDLVMPLFLFIVGTAMPFSLGRRRARGDGPGRIYRHAIWRVAVLWILGMMVQGHLLTYDPKQIHLYSNTLQAIAAGYLVATILMLHLGLVAQVLATGGLLLAYWGLLVLVPVPGHGAGQLTPDVNLAIYLDRLILGRFQDGSHYAWLLAGIAFGATTMLGVFAGRLLRSGLSGPLKTAILLALGFGCLGLGYAWGQRFPIIKHLWTSSFVLYAGGMSYLLLALFYFLIDVCRLRRWAFFFVVIGANAIAVYVANNLFDFRQIGDIFLKPLIPGMGAWGPFVRSLAGFTVSWLILWWMYRKKSFVRI